MIPKYNKISIQCYIKKSYFYGWVIVILSTFLFAIFAWIFYSYGIFFKPIASDFGWNRAATSGVFSLFLIAQGVFGVIMGWFADKYGPSKVMALCGLLIASGLILSSQINSLWQYYLSYGIIVGIGIGGVWPVLTGTTARWFDKRRGLALGIITSGIGLGTLVFLPLTERLVFNLGWSQAYIIIGVSVLIVISLCSPALRRPPNKIMGIEGVVAKPNSEKVISRNREVNQQNPSSKFIFSNIFKTKQLWLLILIYCLFDFSLLMVMVHLVNYATDMNVNPLIAATFLSVVGLSSLTGRLGMGTISDKIGSTNTLVICCLGLLLSLILLIFTDDIGMFYVFSVIFGFAYGGEVTLMAALVSRFFGLASIAAVIGIVGLGSATGGAVGSWLAGSVFDITRSYQISFITATVASFLAVIITIMLRRINTVTPD